MRAVIKFLLGLVLVLAIAWVGLWWYAEGRLQNGFETWADSQAANGYKISYTALNRGTSPMRALVNITDLTVTPPATVTGQTATFTLPGMALRIEALNPLVFHLDLPNKISLTAGDIGVVLNTGSIAASYNLDPNALFNKAVYPFRGGDFSAGNIDVLASEGSLLVLHIDSLTSHADLNSAAGAADTAMASNVSFSGIALSPLFTKVAQIPFNGQISSLSFGVILSGPVPDNLRALAAQLSAATAASDKSAQQKIIIPVVRKWASQGGSGSFSLGLTIGPSTAKANAAVKFDANLQPAGTAGLSADHLDEFTAAIASAYPQVQDTISQAEAQLTPYLTTTATGGQTLGMNATYGPPGISINGTKVADMPPVNWDALENPPPPAPAAQ